jgi:endonuclease YncB( thermonuclease family)
MAFLAGFGVSRAQQAVGQGRLLYVYASDGDSFRLPSGERIRGLGWDSPELEARCDREYRLAAKAASLAWQLASEGLTFERRGLDRYGRTLAVVRTRTGRDVADIMVGAGLARRYSGGRRGSWCK